MSENFTEIKQTIDSLVELKFLPEIKGKIKDQRQFVEKCRVEFMHLHQIIDDQQSMSRPDSIDNAIRLNKKIKTLISGHFENDGKKSFQELFPDFSASVEKFISETPKIITEYQDTQRFETEAKDKWHVKLRKPFKKFFLYFSNLPVSVSNIFRKLFRKPVKSKKKWKRFVRLREMRQLFLYYLLNLKLLELKRKFYRLRSSTIRELWIIYEALDESLNQKLFNSSKEKTDIYGINIAARIMDLQSDLTDFEELLTTEAKLLVEPLFEEYEDTFAKAGTIEYPGRMLRKGVLRKKKKQLDAYYSFIHDGWENNFTALGDDWQMNNEVYLIRYNTLSGFEKYKLQFETNIKVSLMPHSEKMISFIRELRELLNSSKNKTELINSFGDIKNRIQKQLTDNLIPEFTSSLLDQNLSGIIAEFDNLIQEQINQIKNQRLLVKTDEYDKEIKHSEMNTFSPKEILEYSAAPKYFRTSSKLKSKINLQVQKIQNDLSEIDHILDFTIDSAINKLQTNDDTEQAKVIAVEGIDRSIKKMSETEQRINDLLLNFNEELYAAKSEFNADLKSLTQTDKIFDIRLNLAKAKALKRARQVRKQIIEKIRNILPHIYWLIRNSLRLVKNQYHKVRGLFGLAPKAKAIASEISDYLAETQTAVLRLPFVYQRLFEVKPLDDERLFFGREIELKELNKALANWQKEKFAPTIIVGEKGSGATSLINNFLSATKNDTNIIRHSVLFPLSDSKDLLKLFSDILKTQNLKSPEDAISYLNSFEKKHFIIIENLQRLFLRKVDGFNALKMFFEIISKTNKNIFWLSTCTLYSWIYLNKTLNASDYFGYTVNLRKLNEEQITNLVSKRHRISGYNIDYDVDESVLKSKAYKKLAEEERQPYLREKYFSELNKFAQSNISLALIFWLRSAKDIVNDVIKIGSPPDLDYSFLENLSNDKVFTLAALLIHDGLTIEDHSRLFNYPIHKCRLLFLLMYDDGIIVEQNGLYLINPLLYRQIVGLLKSKNIIH